MKRLILLPLLIWMIGGIQFAVADDGWDLAGGAMTERLARGEMYTCCAPGSMGYDSMMSEYNKPTPPPAIDIAPTYSYPGAITPVPSVIVPPSQQPHYAYPGANEGDPVTVILPNGMIRYVYPGRR